MNNKLVVFKGSKKGISIILNGDASFEAIKNELSDKLMQARGFFGETALNIEILGRDVLDDEQDILKNLFNDILKNDCKITFSQSKNENDFIKPVNSTAYDLFSLDEGITKFYKKTVRSGQRIEALCNLVIVGDVNPGAELLAYGNIVVFGSLKGIVHAGCNGNKDAFVTALSLNPSQLRIADIYTRSPDQQQESSYMPEIAYIKNNEIIIEPFLTKKVH